MGDPQNHVVSPRTSKTAYDLAAPFYDNWEWQKFWRQYEYPIIRAKVEAQARQSSSELAILDLGCGTGWYLESLQDLSSDLRGVDISEGMLKIARGRVGRNRVSFGDIRSANLLPNRYDVVLVTRVLSHIKDLNRVFDQIESAISAYGIVIISDIDPLHNYKFTKLPYFDKSVFTETFKHSRRTINAELKSRGFTFESGFVIAMDGKLESISNVNEPTHSVAPAGWVGTWRQLKKKRRKSSKFVVGRKALSIVSDGTVG